ncbi:MAG: Mur ligase family protein [Candidatus Zapsychrus exili]|nr:Mur ligase family protein [Candidatus Zapsychrus exili]
MLDIANKRVTIIGAQKSGIASAYLANNFCAVVKITDKAISPFLDKDTRDWIKENDISLEEGEHTKEFIEDSDLVVLSPGVRFDSDVVKWARDKDILVLGEIEFAYQFCQKPIIAITGSNGKTTVSTLISEVLVEAGYKACLCGNVGSPFSSHVLDPETKNFIVLEVSSFQLESLSLNPTKDCIKGFKPYISVFLNFNQNHLDRHKDLNEYFNAKKQIFLNQDTQDFAVLNFKDERLKALESEIKSKVVYFNDHFLDVKNPNHLAVLRVAETLNIEGQVCIEVFKNFKGVEHRLELTRTISGVDFINDSKATTAESGRWALNNTAKPILMIAGGRDKNIDFNPLKDLVKDCVKKMFVIGEAKEKLIDTFSDVVEVVDCDSLEDAVKKSLDSASEGDVVLLSPMCASFDMFDNFEHRGRVFKEIVNKIKV